MKKSITLIISLVVCLPYDTSTALACSCPHSDKSFKKQVKRAREQAEVVFSGMVIEITRDDRTRLVFTKFEVQDYWKGTGGDEITVEQTLTSCTFFFDMDESYLVYTHSPGDGLLGTSICDRTQPLEGAKKEIKLLRKLGKEEGVTGGMSSPLIRSLTSACMHRARQARFVRYPKCYMPRPLTRVVRR